MAELLKVNDISMVFGGLRAVSNLTMHIDHGELIGLIGPNGAGKTTAFNMITGVYTPTEGEVYFNGEKSSGKKSYQVTQMGMARTFQNIRLFSELSVIDNVKIAYNMHVSYNMLDAIIRDKKYINEEEILAQVENPQQYNDEVIFPDKVKINLEYYHNRTFWGDIKIIFKTIFRYKCRV